MKNPALALLLLGLALGAVVGSGVFTFGYGQGTSYMTNDPTACANCHVMQEYLSEWGRSSHRAVAVCNDCHAPHDFVGKWYTKALNGWNHSVAFTTGDYPVHMRMTDYNRGVTEEACRYCHSGLAEAVDGPGHDEERACLTCHSGVGHPDPPLASPSSPASAVPVPNDSVSSIPEPIDP